MKIRHILNIAFSHRLNSIFNVADENPSQFDEDMKFLRKRAYFWENRAGARKNKYKTIPNDRGKS